MQFRLSTIFLIFFVVAASLAVFCQSEYHGFCLIALWLDAVIFFAAICVNRSESLKSGVIQVAAISFIGLLCTGLLLPAYSHAGPAAYRAVCMNNLKQLAQALHNYHHATGHFPALIMRDAKGKPLLSWRAEILPMMEYGNLFDSLKKDEPWNSTNNAKVTNQALLEFLCPGDEHAKFPCTNTNYIAVTGPGTAWREGGTVKRSDLPDGGSHTVMAVEVVDSGINWAEPRDITGDEALENMKSGKGLRISSDRHSNKINVLFADGRVRDLPSKMLISLWKKLLAGEVMDLDNIEKNIDQSAPDMVDVSVTPSTPGKWTTIFSVVVWLFSVVLLFRRAIKSRRKQTIPVIPDSGNEQEVRSTG